MSKAMTQEDVSFMFSDGWVCFRAFNPQTRAPVALPHFLMPSVPITSKSTWKNKQQRMAERAQKDGSGGIYNNTNTNGNYIPGTPPTAKYGGGGGGGGGAMMGTNKRNNFDGYIDGGTRPGQPRTQEAADSKSGKGQKRRRFFGPVIKKSQRCGVCKACMNPGWKKACEVRRAEMMAGSQNQSERGQGQFVFGGVQVPPPLLTLPPSPPLASPSLLPLPNTLQIL